MRTVAMVLATGLVFGLIAKKRPIRIVYYFQPGVHYLDSVLTLGDGDAVVGAGSKRTFIARAPQ